MSMHWIWIVVLTLGLVMPLQAGTQRSARPFIYVIDYSDHWITDPDAMEEFGDTPPDLLHIGKAVPVTHNWGPIPYMAGENQRTGGPGHTLSRENIRLLSPEELEEKIERITAAVDRIHEAGVELLMPYICFYTLAGDHEQRVGIWELYDNWEDYARWLGPKPPTGPTEWLMRTPDGERVDPGYGFTPPYYDPLHRYGACPNNPSWNQYSRAIVRLIAQCGHDGTFVDNSTRHGHGCPHCQEAFPTWVRENFDEETLRRACGEDYGEIEFGNPKLQAIQERWNKAVIRDRLAMLREAGREMNPDFMTFPNCGRYQYVVPLGDGCDFLMFESVDSPGCLFEGELPEDPEALVQVADDAELQMGAIAYEAVHSQVFSEVSGTVHYPATCPPGEAVELAVDVESVGASNRDGDCLEELTLRLTHLQSGEAQSVPMGPLPGVGDPAQVQGARRPPARLTGTWTPAEPGAYAIDVSYLYTDAEHIEVADRAPVADRLGLGSLYRVNLAGLSCTFTSRCRTVSLSYTHTREGLERLQELAIAEGAASGGKHAPEARGEPLAKYGRFFEAHGDVSEGLAPYGSVALLYAYWGGNPGQIGRDSGRTVAEHLSSRHILFHGLLDRDLSADDLTPAAGRTLVLVCPHYDLTARQIAAIRQFVADGGRLIIQSDDAQINFTPIREVLGDVIDDAEAWDWEDPPRFGEPLCASNGRLRGVRFTAFAEPTDSPTRLVLHAVNYNVTATESNPGQLTPVADIRVAVPVPAAWAGATATVYDPDAAAPVIIDCSVADGVAEVELPTLRVYQMIELRAG
ncbi:MAG: hypothetical protein ACP5KN_06145 [Armatimonadota bacterium]